MITEDYVRKIFKGLEQGDGASFFEHVNDKVDWIKARSDSHALGTKDANIISSALQGWANP